MNCADVSLCQNSIQQHKKSIEFIRNNKVLGHELKYLLSSRLVIFLKK